MTRCGAKTKSGNPCGRPTGWGTGHAGVGRCKLHGGASPQAELTGQVALARSELAVMGVELPAESHEAILKCIRIAHGEVAYCTARIAELGHDEAVGQPVLTTERPRKLEKGAESKAERVIECRQESPRLNIWVVARHAAMDRLVAYSATALKAGVEERQVKIAEQQGAMVAEAFRLFALQLGHDPGSQSVRDAMRASITAVAGVGQDDADGGAR
jgi:hypothetical protein